MKPKFLTVAAIGMVAVLFTSQPTVAAATKKKPKKAPTTKKAPKRATTTVAATTSGDPLVGQLGEFRGSGDANKALLVAKWGFPTWWPAVDGTVGSVGDSRSSFNPGGARTRRLSQVVILDAATTADQLADKVGDVPGFTRRPAVNGKSPIGLPNSVVTFASTQDASSFEIEALTDPAIGKRYLAFFTYITPTTDLTFPNLPGLALTGSAPSLTGAQANSVSMTLYNVVYDVLPTPKWYFNTQTFAVYNAQFNAVAADALPSFAAVLPQGFTLKSQTDLRLEATGPFETRLSFFVQQGNALIFVSRPEPTLLSPIPN